MEKKETDEEIAKIIVDNALKMAKEKEFSLSEKRSLQARINNLKSQISKRKQMEREFIRLSKEIKIEQGEMKGKTLWELMQWHDIERKFDKLAGEKLI